MKETKTFILIMYTLLFIFCTILLNAQDTTYTVDPCYQQDYHLEILTSYDNFQIESEHGAYTLNSDNCYWAILTRVSKDDCLFAISKLAKIKTYDDDPKVVYRIYIDFLEHQE